MAPDWVLKASIRKMMAACSRQIYLYWFAGEPSWETHSRNLMTLLHGSSFHPMPRSDVLFNVLYQMGIYPHIRVFPYQHINVFSCMEEAVGYFSRRYRVSGDAQEKVLRNYLDNVLQEENGFLILYSPATCLKMWWKKQPVIDQMILSGVICG